MFDQISDAAPVDSSPKKAAGAFLAMIALEGVVVGLRWLAAQAGLLVQAFSGLVPIY